MSSETDIWQDWLQWLPTAPPTDRPRALFAFYHTKLIESGIPEAEADSQLATVQQKKRTESDGWQVMFNNIYANPTPDFNTAPNALLVAAVHSRTPGRALDMSAGQGRNAVFLATNGWEVTAVDVSDEGLHIAAASAERAGVHIHTVQQSINQFDLGTAQWDVIAAIYAPVPLTSPQFASRLITALRPGGLLVVESFASDAAAHGRRPVDPAALQRAYAALHTLRFEDVVAIADWEKDATRLVRFVGAGSD